MKKFHSYIANQFIKHIFFTLLVIMVIVFIFLFIEMLKNSNFDITLLLALLRNYDEIIITLPLIIFIGLMSTLFTLHKKNELVTLLSIGVSEKKITIIATAVVTGFWMLHITLFLSLNNNLISIYEELSGSKINKLQLSNGGMWIKQNNSIINIGNSITIWPLSNDKIVMIKGDDGKINGDTLNISNAQIIQNDGKKNTEDFSFKLNGSIENFSTISLKTIPLWQLLNVISNFEKCGISTTAYELYFYNNIFMLITFLTMILLSFHYGFYTTHRSYNMKMVLKGIFIAFIIYFASDAINSKLNHFGIFISVLLPKILFLIITFYIYTRGRDDICYR